MDVQQKMDLCGTANLKNASSLGKISLSLLQVLALPEHQLRLDVKRMEERCQQRQLKSIKQQKKQRCLNLVHSKMVTFAIFGHISEVNVTKNNTFIYNNLIKRKRSSLMRRPFADQLKQVVYDKSLILLEPFEPTRDHVLTEGLT